MNGFLTRAGNGKGAFIYAVVSCGIAGAAVEVLPVPFPQVVIGGLGLWYLWRYILMPFKAGLAQHDEPADKNN